MSRLIETIRISDGKALNIEYHKQRIQVSSLAVFGGEATWQMGSFENPGPGTFKLRIVYDQASATMSFEPYTIRPVRTLRLTVNDDIVYDHKYENRGELEAMFARRGDCDDVLVVKEGVITDTSYANIIFRKDGSWVTPDSYLLNGTMRQCLLDAGKISEQRITPGDISDFTHFKLINAMVGDEAPESEVSNIR